ncbi:hypothetical protein COV93_03015 [Candidatus Woesearchaeota archaeon CG11_big_fil_rev_8_21_14_0_20_43_8]|nr:MAG: hypothetical protein COV93_03015 [Candidatus Woesearchaeota archaeon CG11_big_fil_rev_8_21_14_0_20_43_8]
MKTNNLVTILALSGAVCLGTVGYISSIPLEKRVEVIAHRDFNTKRYKNYTPMGPVMYCEWSTHFSSDYDQRAALAKTGGDLLVLDKIESEGSCKTGILYKRTTKEK